MFVGARKMGKLTNYSEKQGPGKDHGCHKGNSADQSGLEKGMHYRVMHVSAQHQPVGMKSEPNQGRDLEKLPPPSPNGRAARKTEEFFCEARGILPTRR